MAIMDRMRSAWNAFVGNDNANPALGDSETGAAAPTLAYGGFSPSRPRFRYINDRSIVSSVYTRLAVDVAAVQFRHIMVDSDLRYTKDMDSNLNSCLLLEPNLDQGPRAFLQDIAMTLFDKGVAAVVPVDTTVDPNSNEVIDIYSIRVGEIVTWYPNHVRVNLYNEKLGYRQDVTLEKRFVAIVENPLYMVMNQPNSTLQRLIRKLNLLDVVDEQSSSGQLDLIIQLPYAIKSEARKKQAEDRRADIEFQLRGSQYGIAYADATEKITQLNRPATNNLLTQVEYLITMLYGQLGITEEVMNGTADEKSMTNYYHRTTKPIVEAIREAMQRALIGHQGTAALQRIDYFSDPFRFIPTSMIAEVADKFTRNEILTGNEIRGFMGVRPSDDPKADELRNSNLPRADTETGAVQLEGVVNPKPPAPPLSST